MKYHYTAGFAFDPRNTKLLLIHKLKGPKGVQGRLNAIGGKIEAGETPVVCQRREFREETGIDVPEERWTHTVHLVGPHGGGWEVYFFRTELTEDEAKAAKSMEAEQVGWYEVAEVPRLNVVCNLRWLVPMQQDPGLEIPAVLRER